MLKLKCLIQLALLQHPAAMVGEFIRYALCGTVSSPPSYRLIHLFLNFALPTVCFVHEQVGSEWADLCNPSIFTEAWLDILCDYQPALPTRFHMLSCVTTPYVYTLCMWEGVSVHLGLFLCTGPLLAMPTLKGSFVISVHVSSCAPLGVSFVIEVYSS